MSKKNKQYNISINIFNIKDSNINKRINSKNASENETKHANTPNSGQPPSKFDNNDSNNRLPVRLIIIILIILLIIILLLLVLACLIVDAESFNDVVQLVDTIIDYILGTS